MDPLMIAVIVAGAVIASTTIFGRRNGMLSLPMLAGVGAMFYLMSTGAFSIPDSAAPNVSILEENATEEYALSNITFYYEEVKEEPKGIFDLDLLDDGGLLE